MKDNATYVSYYAYVSADFILPFLVKTRLDFKGGNDRMEELTESFRLYRGVLLNPDEHVEPELCWDGVKATANFFLDGDERKHRTWLKVNCPIKGTASPGKLLVLLTMRPGPLGVYTFNGETKTWQFAEREDPALRFIDGPINGLINKNSRGVMNYSDILVLNTTPHIARGSIGLGEALENCDCNRLATVRHYMAFKVRQELRDVLTQQKLSGADEVDFVVATGPFEPKNGGLMRLEMYTAIIDDMLGKNSIPAELGLKVRTRAVKLNANKVIPYSKLRITSCAHPNESRFDMPIRAREVNGFDGNGKPLRAWTFEKDC